MGVIIAIVNNKGGVGKTTVACNLAHALGLMGKRVLVVDLDSQCNATALLIPKEDPPHPSLYELPSRTVQELSGKDGNPENHQVAKKPRFSLN
jgi:chromosome partitioning protein